MPMEELEKYIERVVEEYSNKIDSLKRCVCILMIEKKRNKEEITNRQSAQKRISQEAKALKDKACKSEIQVQDHEGIVDECTRIENKNQVLKLRIENAKKDNMNLKSAIAELEEKVYEIKSISMNLVNHCIIKA